MNKLGVDLKDKVVMVKGGMFAKVFGGFGQSPESNGSALFATYTDGTTADIRNDVVRLASEDEIAYFHASIYKDTERRLLRELERAQINLKDAERRYHEGVAAMKAQGLK